METLQKIKEVVKLFLLTQKSSTRVTRVLVQELVNLLRNLKEFTATIKRRDFGTFKV
jgi:hypothetical protein